MTSVLNTIKKMLGIDESIDHFDTDIIVCINSSLSVVKQLGIGDPDFNVSDSTETWEDFIGDRKDLEFLKSYIYLKTRLMFDPPTNAFLVDSMDRHIKEFEWRLREQKEEEIG